MAIYHLSAKIVSRAQGQSAVASAAYRSASVLQDERLQQTFDYGRKQGVEHAEILAPESAPDWIKDRQRLWNEVERVERRKDAQLAREIELALPVELGCREQVELVRDYARQAFVSKGMVVDLTVHRDNPENPHAHLLLTTRSIGRDGFGAKERSWNAKSQLVAWRSLWADAQNQHLVWAGLGLQVDHRSFKDQGLELEPGRKIGIGHERQNQASLPPKIQERVEEQRQIARENGARIIADPSLALRALTHRQATFSDHDLVKWLNTRTDGAEQFAEAHLKITAHSQLIQLGRDDRGSEHYTSLEMRDVERDLLGRGERMAARDGHGVARGDAVAALEGRSLSNEQENAFEALIAPGDLKSLVGLAGSGKSRLLGAARDAWAAQGYHVRGAALSGIAAENLQESSGIESRTLASLEHSWRTGRDELTAKDVLVIDEAGMLGTRQVARVMEAADKAGAKVVFIGDTEQLQAIEAGAAFRGLVQRTGAAELTEIRRQELGWQREATRSLADGRTAEALAAYQQRNEVKQVENRGVALYSLVARWEQDYTQEPTESRLMLAYTRDDVRDLNTLARGWRDRQGHLGQREMVQTERGEKEIVVGERIYFLRNERSLGVKNGTLATVEKVENGRLLVAVDGREDRVVVDTHLYRDLDYGYAATVHKSQGTTVDRSYVLATSHYDRHTAYVALSRHRKSASIFYASEDFRAPWHERALTAEEARSQFISTLSRERPQHLVHDFVEASNSVGRDHSLAARSIEARQQRGIERWRQLQARSVVQPGNGQSSELVSDGDHRQPDRSIDRHLGL